MSSSVAQAQPSAFRHEALLYSGFSEFVDGVAAFIRGGIETSEPVLVVAAAEKIRALQSELRDDETRDVAFADWADVGHNPARALPAWEEFLAAHAGEDRPVRGIGESIDPARSADELVEWQHHENLLNVAFTGGARWWLLCPYDVSALPPAVIDEAKRSHHFLCTDGHHAPSPVVRHLDAMAEQPAAPLSAPPPDADTLRLTSPFDLSAVRSMVREHAGRAGLQPDQVDAVVLAADEIASNGLHHGIGDAALRVWHTRDVVMCEVESPGHFDAPLAGREPPDPLDTRGRGLWLANQFCDLVQVRSRGTRNVVRVQLRAAAPF
jgi:anti-sigma regulatory factor (Ser/Thr protein kinase)